jgi:uncharacterized protein (TIGR03437 family)
MRSQSSQIILTILLVCLVAGIANAQGPDTRPDVRHRVVTLPSTSRVVISGVLDVPLEKPEPFLALGVTWQPVGAQPAKLQLSLRTSVDGTIWSEWFVLPFDQDATVEMGELISSLALLDARTRSIEFRLTAAKPGAELPPTASLRFHFISPGATSHSMLERIRAKQTEPMSENQALPNYPKPPVVSRTAWGCPDGQVTTHGTLSYTSVTHLIVHHTATGNTPPGGDDWAAVVRSIWNFHIFTNGWADIGYNYLVDPDGLIYEGRAGGDNVLGAHFSGVNSGTLGVSLIGTFTEVPPPAKALTSLRRILAWKASQRGLDPLGSARHAASGLELNHISGHRDGPGATECPGAALYPLLPSLRTSVKELLGDAAALASVSAASFTSGALASDSIVAAFGNELATNAQAATTLPLPISLAGTTVSVRDSTNKDFFAPLFFVSPGQVNYLMPAGLALGPATVSVTNAAGRLASGTVTIEPVAPALFAANANGSGVPAAVLLRIKADGTQVYEPMAVLQGNQFFALPIDLSDETEQVFLVAYGTGLRNHRSLETVSARVSNIEVPVLFAGAVEGLPGLDQLNVRLPHTLKGYGPGDFSVLVEGKPTNGLRIRIK